MSETARVPRSPPTASSYASTPGGARTSRQSRTGRDVFKHVRPVAVDHEFKALGLKVRTAIRPVKPLKAHGKYTNDDLDAALARHGDPRDFPPTNFHVIWPESKEVDRKTGKWTSPADMTHIEGRKKASDFPKYLKSHKEEGKPIIRDPHRMSNKTSVPGPATYNSVPIPANVHLVNATIRPQTPREPHHRFVSTPAPGTYNPRPNTFNAPCALFGGAERTMLLSAGAKSLLSDTSGGPGYYDPKKPKMRDYINDTFSRAERFVNHRKKTPGPGHYNTHVKSAYDSHGAHSFSTARRGTRENRNRVGRLNISTKTVSKQIGHKFGTAKRFKGSKKPHKIAFPMHGFLNTEQTRQRLDSRTRYAKKMQTYTAAKKTERMEKKKQQRAMRQHHAQMMRQQLRMEHMNTMDRIINRKIYRDMEKQRMLVKAREQTVVKGWLYYMALGSRMQKIITDVKNARTQFRLGLLASRAANIIETTMNRWLARARERVRKRAALIVCRALRNNVYLQKVKRRRQATQAIVASFTDFLEQRRVMNCGNWYIQQAVLIQRTWRKYCAIRQNALFLLTTQWEAEEKKMHKYYKEQEGTKTFEKQKKKGLLPRGSSSNTVKKQIIANYPVYPVPEDIRYELLFKNYNQRKESHIALVKEYNNMKRLRMLKQDASERELVSREGKDAGSLERPPPMEQPPYFKVLLEKKRLHQLMSQGHGSMNNLPPGCARTMKRILSYMYKVDLKQKEKLRRLAEAEKLQNG